MMFKILLALFGVGVIAGVAHNAIYFFHIVPFLSKRDELDGKPSPMAYKENFDSDFNLRSELRWLRVTMSLMRGLFLIAWLLLVLALFILWRAQ